MPSSDARRTDRSPRSAHLRAAGWTLLVCLALLIPGDVRPLGDVSWSPPAGSDKLVHGVLFFIETRLLVGSFRHLRPGPPPVAAAVLAALVLGAVTEAAQLWVPYRDGSGADLLADALGACAFPAWRAARRRRPRNTK